MMPMNTTIGMMRSCDEGARSARDGSGDRAIGGGAPSFLVDAWNNARPVAAGQWAPGAASIADDLLTVDCPVVRLVSTPARQVGTRSKKGRGEFLEGMAENQQSVGETALDVRELSHRFGGRHALDHVSCTIEPGMFAIVLGQNGGW
jgi:hypothetical protein